jgi:large subunit ribosomal protein L25
MASLTLSAEERKLKGRKIKSLRRQGLLPANIFGNKVKSTAIQIGQTEFQKLFLQAGETNLVTLKLKGSDDRPVLISNVQVDPITDLPIHVDFHQVDLKEKVTATVSVELVGEAPAVKEKGGVLFTIHNEIEVEALPTDLPDKLEIDISSLNEIGDSILAKDIKVDRSKISLAIEEEETIVAIQEQKEEEEEPEPVAAEEGEEAETAGAGETEKAEGKAEAKEDGEKAEAKETEEDKKVETDKEEKKQ